MVGNIPLLSGKNEMKTSATHAHTKHFAVRCSLVMLLPLCTVALASAQEESVASAAAGRRRALVVCGLPGDLDHRKLFAEAIEKLYQALTAIHGFAPADVAVLFSDETIASDGPALTSNRGPATREKLSETVSELVNTVQPADTVWVFVLGHTHHDGRSSWLNLPGPDMNQADFGKLFAALRCREQAFFITTPVSGFFVKPLSAVGRVVIAATDADLEVNETLFPHKLIAALADASATDDFDVDGDGRRTLFDAYLLAARETAKDYASGELLATEHALLDDDGNGRGTEVQIDYLSEELGGRLRAGRPLPAPRPGDGALARTIMLPAPAAQEDTGTADD
jgi:hypothetical protein